MSDVEKAISGLVEEEELLQQQQQQQQSTPLNKININNYNLQNETGNSTLLPKHNNSSNNSESQQSHPQQHITFQQQDSNTNTANGSNYLTAQQQQHSYNCLSRLAKLIFSTPGLVVMVVVYTIMGAFIFPLLEAPQDISKSALIAKSREECLKELWIITEKLNVLYERNWTMLVHEQLRRFEGTIVAATRNMAAAGATAASGASTGGYVVGGAGGMATETTTTALGRYGGNNLVEYSDLTATRWSFSEALLYSVTVITTIGHGSLTPRTAGGKIATIFYALIGVPLMLMCLSSLGALLAEALQCTYARLCCRWPHYMGDDGDDLEHDIHNTKHQRTKRQQRNSNINMEKSSAHLEIKQRLQHSCDFQEHKNDINCKNCKYDAIIGESNTNHGYDYKLCNDATTATTSSTSASSGPATTTTAMTTMKLGHKEDCCQLLQNSPGKLTQHLSSCMQLKMSPTMTVSGGSNTNTTPIQPQQQYYQQRPDVMLMTTGHKLSSQQPATMATACRMVLPPSIPLSQVQRFYTNTTPAMATYHIVSSASANSSPTHHQTIRHYIVPQLPPPPPTSSTSASGTQHFMAVPSSMLRFHQTSPQTSIQQQHQQQQQQQQCAGNVTSNININPLALPVSGSATVYFPIVTPAAVAPNTTLSGSSSGPSSQPLVKYHTIQMPHKRQHGLTLLQQTDLHDNQVINAVEDVDCTLFPPPPPPAYQTATVHGIRRAKFLTKPLPQEINTLLHESDISCRHDLSQNLPTFNSSSSSNSNNLVNEQQQQHQLHNTLIEPTATATTASVMLSSTTGIETETSLPITTTTTAGNNFYGSSNTSTTTASTSPASTATLTNNTNSNSNTTTIYENHESATHHNTQQQHGQIGLGMMAAGAVSTAGGATAAVDIMEDEEEQEQQRLGNCPHGTPSRVPLLTNSALNTEDKSQTRSFFNATAASFHRHTLNTFQRSSNTLNPQRKSVIINRKGECNLHIPKRRNSSGATLCYGDQYDDTSDDDCGGLEGTNIYKLKHLQPQQPQTDKHLMGQDDYCDNHSLVSLSESSAQIPQVPIIVVLFILVFYVCLGTVIFALWENWSLIDGAYFCFVTLTTIGYGDFVPLKTFQGPEIQLFACCAYLLLGLVLVAMSFSILETQLIWKCKRLAVRLKLAKE
ncbi:hypothetical protein FF38_12351 [Lucilia cuprina]|uniref:Potassium channel domain-containing protein n=1 Tax=Lucilia cuprina TaxID=7375 RepID=A0A0L0C5H1_LUCCU|nr:TWiK family of potassium channels protein 7 [Lucilia cuprina]KNC27492.1 hypothetical protein FF38_12351 [Lucilia cuprina]